MKNFKRIIAIALVVMMVVPMMTTGLTVSAFTAGTETVSSTTGTLVADGNWKLFASATYGDSTYNNTATLSVSSGGQLTATTPVNSYDFAQNPRTVLQSMSTTAIDGLVLVNANLKHSQAIEFYPVIMSYAFTKQQLQGELNSSTFSMINGFAVDNAMVKDGLVITFLNYPWTSVTAGSAYNYIGAYVYVDGKVVSSQIVETSSQGKEFALVTNHPNMIFFGTDNDQLKIHIQDTYSAGDYINQTYTFDTLDLSTVSMDTKDYYFSVGTGNDWAANGSDNNGYFGSPNFNIARIGTFTYDADTNKYSADITENVADWTGHGIATCEHQWGEWEVTVEPTCTTTGTKVRVCALCGESDEETIPANGHTWSDWTVVSEATCTVDGSKTRTCSVCGEEDTATIDKAGHQWSDWTVVSEATCTVDGSKTRTCSVCGEEDTAVIAAPGHDWAWEYTKLPTFTESGSKTRTCSVCGETETDDNAQYELGIYWTTASSNKVSALSSNYAPYDDNVSITADTSTGKISALDMSIMYGGDFCYYPLTKITSNFATDLAYFYATVKPVSSTLNGKTAYPTTLNFIWTNKPENYDDAAEQSTSVAPSSIGCANALESSRYGHMWNNYLAGEYTYSVTLADYTTIGKTTYGTADDGYYEYVYQTVVSKGNYWGTKMNQLSTPIAYTNEITVTTINEINPETNKYILGVDFNGETIIADGFGGSQLGDTSYYFGVAAYGYGANDDNASFELLDVCGVEPALFTGYVHEHAYEDVVTKAATCTEDGTLDHKCLFCGDVESSTVIPATGHSFAWYETEYRFKCTECGTVAQAAINTTTPYLTLLDAYAAAEEGDTITLYAEAKLTEPLEIRKSIVIDLCGRRIKNTAGGTALKVYTDLTINDSPTPATTNKGRVWGGSGTSCCAIQVYTGTLTINGGTYKVGPDENGLGNATIEATGDATVIINDGLFYTDAAYNNFYYVLNVTNKSSATFVVKGGTFRNYDPSKGDDYLGGNFVPEGYLVVVDGTDYIVEPVKNADATANARVITISDLAQAKDVFIAAGEYTTYREVKNNMLYGQTVTADTMEYTVPADGVYTVAVRYNDGRDHSIFTVTVENPVPTVVGDGLQAIVSGITGVKYIRVCEGDVAANAMKSAAGCRTMLASTIGDTDTYAVQFSEGGTYTVYVVMNSGVTHREVVTLTPKTAGFAQDGNKVTFTNLDDLYVLRYALGEYTTSAQIKRADGAKVLRASAAVDGAITVELASGTYTFCAQFYDGSYNYYTITVD